MKVLLAESDKPAAESIKAALKMCGCQVVSVATAGGCLTMAHQKEFDLLLIDLALPRPPGVSCEEVIRQLKDLHWDMEIVTMASENTRDLELRIRRHGILCYLIKPVLPRLVRELVLHLQRRVLSGC
jgi:DNA-binding response OmpR family regulator